MLSICLFFDKTEAGYAYKRYAYKKKKHVRQKGESQKTGVTRKQSTPNFPKKEHFLPPDTHTYMYVSVGKKCSFLEKMCVL